MFTGLSNHIERTIVSIRRAIQEMEEEILFDYDLTLTRQLQLRRDIATKRQQLKVYRRQLKALH